MFVCQWTHWCIVTCLFSNVQKESGNVQLPGQVQSAQSWKWYCRALYMRHTWQNTPWSQICHRHTIQRGLVHLCTFPNMSGWLGTRTCSDAGRRCVYCTHRDPCVSAQAAPCLMMHLPSAHQNLKEGSLQGTSQAPAAVISIHMTGAHTCHNSVEQ